MCPTCSRVPRALLPYVSHALRALVPYVTRALRALVPYVLSYPKCPTCLMSHVPGALRALVPHTLRVPVFHVSQASRFKSSFSLRTLLFRTLRILYPSVTFCALEFPCFTLLFFCSFVTSVFLDEFTKVKTNIVCQ